MKLKFNLLLPLLDNSFTTNRYTKAFINLKNVLDLEKKDDYKFKDEIVYEKFENLTKQYNYFLNEIPLTIIERYYYQFSGDLNKYCYLEYQEKELTDMRIIELYEKLEIFFNNCFELACLIANLYNLEIKLNNKNNSDDATNYF